MTKFAKIVDFPNQFITKTVDGYMWDINEFDTFKMFFDEEGNYTHQLQEDMIDTGTLKFVSRGVKPLTKEQMAEGREYANQT